MGQSPSLELFPHCPASGHRTKGTGNSAYNFWVYFPKSHLFSVEVETCKEGAAGPTLTDGDAVVWGCMTNSLSLGSWQ